MVEWRNPTTATKATTKHNLGHTRGKWVEKCATVVAFEEVAVSVCHNLLQVATAATLPQFCYCYCWLLWNCLAFFFCVVYFSDLAIPCGVCLIWFDANKPRQVAYNCNVNNRKYLHIFMHSQYALCTTFNHIRQLPQKRLKRLKRPVNWL